MHNLFTDIECYAGNYVTFTILAALFAILMIFFISFVILINFECRFDSDVKKLN